MKRLQVMTIFSFAMSLGVCAQSINLTGKVSDAITGAPLQGVYVTLINNPEISDSTGADGVYHLSPVSVNRKSVSFCPFTGSRLRNGILEINTLKPEPVTVDVFSLNGARKTKLINNKIMVPGLNYIDLREVIKNASLYLLRVKQGNETSILKVLPFQASTPGNTSARASSAFLYKTKEFNDTIVFIINGFATNKIAIYSSSGENDVALQVAGNLSVPAVSISYDYTSGNIGLYSISDTTAYKNLLSTWSDNDVRAFGGSLYILERYGKDNLLKINGSEISSTNVTYEKNIGQSVNIQDIACINSSKAYITQYASSQVVIIDPSTGLKSSKTIDLSPYNTYTGTDSMDVVPYMSKELYYNGKVYIACQRLKAPAGGYIQAADTSKIIVINATTDSVVKAINLAYKNPQELSIFNGKLYVGSVGIWGVNDGGVEAIDLATDSNIGSIADESAFSGDIASIIVVSDIKGYAVISTPAFNTELHSFNPQTKTVGIKISGIDAPCSGHMAFDGAYVYVGDRSNLTPGIVIIDPKTDTKVGTTKNVGLPPNSLALLLTNN